MHIRKYDREFSRRHFLRLSAMGVASAGVLGPFWEAFAQTGDGSQAYPDELLSIDAYTQGKLSVGDVITADNVEIVKDLIDPVCYQQVKTMGRRIKLGPTITDLYQLMPHEYLEATLSNTGKAAFDANGNVVTKADGSPWIGGNPFPDPQTGDEVMASQTMSWGRHDSSFYAVKEWDYGARGQGEYAYEFNWSEMQGTGRLVLDPKPHWREDHIRYQSIFFVSPNDVKGSSFLNVWPYDQNEFPELQGYLPAFKRVRRFPTNQRFEPVIPGSTFFLSDAWATGDPFRTWGNYKIVGRGPFLGCVGGDWAGDRPNWEKSRHQGDPHQFFDLTFQLIPDVVVVEAEPVKYPRAPVSKKRVWIDARTGIYCAYVTYDRRGEVWKSFEPSYSLYRQGDVVEMDGKHPLWSWIAVMTHDIQTNRLTLLEQVESTRGGYRSHYNDQSDYDKYLTVQAINRLGA